MSNTAAGGSGGDGGTGATDPVRYGVGGNGGNGGNGANGMGGGIGILGGIIALTNVTCLNNMSTGGSVGLGGGGGGGEAGGANGTNGANGLEAGTAEGATIAEGGGSFFVENSILDCAQGLTNGWGLIIDAGYNINSDATDLFTNGTSLNNTNPLLGVLGNYGGPTETVPLLLGSPAINAADPLAFPPTDQRGYPRPSGPGPDTGAFEYTYPSLKGVLLNQGTVQFLLNAELSNLYVIEFSSNLINWSAIDTNTVSTNGPAVISAATATNANRGFYRIVIP